MSMPVPMMNVINGGAHADNSLDLQDFMLVPLGLPTFKDALRCGSEVFHALKKLLKQKGLSTAVGDEGGFAPHLENHEAAIKLIMEAISGAGYVPGVDVALALDCASSEFYADGVYTLGCEDKTLKAAELVDLLAGWCEQYPIISIEDGMAENDWDGWKLLTQRMGKKDQPVGEERLGTKTKMIARSMGEGMAKSGWRRGNKNGTRAETGGGEW